MRSTSARQRRACRIAPALLAAAALLVPRPTGAEAGEYEAKAAFLLSFAQFVEWPHDAFPAPGAPIVLGVAGEDPFGRTLDRLVRGRTAQGRRFAVRRYPRVDRLGPCHILFIAPSEDPAEWLEALERRRSPPVLTVGEGGEFRQHLAISFLNEERRVRLAVNLDVVDESRLRVSSTLLAVAQIVTRRFRGDGR